jgi:crossover junction endodeoxyribonuclease RusA
MADEIETVEIPFPVEVVLHGVPLSLQASAQSRKRWQDRIRTAARAALSEFYFATEAPIAVTIYYFPDGPMDGDLDNIVKPILDSFSRFMYIDDRQVERIWVQKFEPSRPFTFKDPTPKLAAAIEAEGPRVYLHVDVAEVGEVP